MATKWRDQSSIIKLVAEPKLSLLSCLEGASRGVMISKRDLQILTGEFKSHWGSHSYDLVPHLSKTLRKLLFSCLKGALNSIMGSKLASKSSWWVWVSLGAPFIRPRATSKQKKKLSKLLLFYHDNQKAHTNVCVFRQGSGGFSPNKPRVVPRTTLWHKSFILLRTLQLLDMTFSPLWTLSISCNSCILSIKFPQGINILLLIHRELFHIVWHEEM